jgi:P-type Ca2+ transporter type 2C
VKPDESIHYHALSPDEVIRALQSHSEQGISADEARARHDRYGPNRIAGARQRRTWQILWAQFRSPIVYLLVVAAGVSFWLGEWVDAVAILIVLLVNTCIGFYMEFQAERSMNALRKMSAAPAKVVRSGQLTEVDSEAIVPGDLVFVEAGDLVPADGRIISLSQLQADESPLTGESIPVEKQLPALDPAAILAERSNMLYKGTYISKGNAYFAATVTGMATELGQVASLVESAEQAATPLEKKLEEFSKRLIKITSALVAAVFAVGLLYGQKVFEILETSIALAVAAIPEGLPIVATMALAQGMMKMARRKVIVKKLSAVETLGGTSVICTDKTGTLTKNRIEVARVESATEEAGQLITDVCVHCNTAEIYRKDGEDKELGDPLEVALLKYAVKQGVSISTQRARQPKVREEAFSSETKIMATMHKDENSWVVYAKGAAEELLQRCTGLFTPAGAAPLAESAAAEWLQKAEAMAAAGLRVIAAARKTAVNSKDPLTSDLVFLGLIGMIDPPREEVPAAIRECHSAGIQVILITGDHPSTAKNIAEQLQISRHGDTAVMLGKDMKDFEQLGKEGKERWCNTNVFARVSPKQKLDIISVWQERKHVVAMTGDGINDAPALQKADIGVAMGQRGTQVAQEVADMILKDDSFSSIVLAIRQGRIIFENIRKFVIYLLSSNLSELMVIAIAAVFNLHFQLLPLQILFINLITDVLPALALGMSEGALNIMQHPPRRMSEPIIDRKRWRAIFIYAAAIALSSTAAVFSSHFTLHETENWRPDVCNNVLFYSLIFGQLLHVLNMGSTRVPLHKSEIMKNVYVWLALGVSFTIIFGLYFIPVVREALDVRVMSWPDWFIAAGGGLTSFILIRFFVFLKLINY